MINKFDSRDHLISCLLASCYIPMYSMGYKGVPPIINQEVHLYYYGNTKFCEYVLRNIFDAQKYLVAKITIIL